MIVIPGEDWKYASVGVTRNLTPCFGEPSRVPEELSRDPSSGGGDPEVLRLTPFPDVDSPLKELPASGADVGEINHIHGRAAQENVRIKWIVIVRLFIPIQPLPSEVIDDS